MLKTLGMRDEPGCDATHLNKPTDLAITPDGQVFVTDGYGNSRWAVHFDRGRQVRQGLGQDGRWAGRVQPAGGANGAFNIRVENFGEKMNCSSARARFS